MRRFRFPRSANHGLPSPRLAQEHSALCLFRQSQAEQVQGDVPPAKALRSCRYKKSMRPVRCTGRMFFAESDSQARTVCIVRSVLCKKCRRGACNSAQDSIYWKRHGGQARRIRAPAVSAPSFRRFRKNGYRMAKSQKAFRRAALPHSLTGWLFGHILISMSIGRMTLWVIRSQNSRLAARTIEFAIVPAIR